MPFGLSNLSGSKQSVGWDGLVDRGATFPLIPETVLLSLGMRPKGKKIFTLADGSQKKLPVGETRLTYNGIPAPCLVVFAPQGAEPLGGALALESLGLEVDPVNRRLKPATPYLA